MGKEREKPRERDIDGGERALGKKRPIEIYW
jgi:hypothetical protein